MNSCEEKRKNFRNGFINNFTLDGDEVKRGRLVFIFKIIPSFYLKIKNFRLSSLMIKKKDINHKKIIRSQKSCNSSVGRNWNEFSTKRINPTTELRSTHSGRTALAKQRLNLTYFIE
jgi:hypothetical protein